MSDKGLGRVETKSDLVVMPSGTSAERSRERCAGFAPPLDGSFRQRRLTEMMRQQFGFDRSAGRELIAQDLAHATV